MAVNQIIKDSQAAAEASQPSNEDGGKTRKKVKAGLVESLRKAEAERIAENEANVSQETQGDEDDKGADKSSKKPESKEPDKSDDKNADADDGNAEFRKAHYEKKMAELRAEREADAEKAKQAAAASDKKAGDDQRKGESKFELPKFEIPDFSKFPEDEDLTPHLTKAFNHMAEVSLKTFEALMAKMEEMGVELKDVSDFATDVSEARSRKINKAFTEAVAEAKEALAETYGIDEDDVSIYQSFVKLWKGGVVELDLHNELPDKEMVLKAWRIDNADILEKHVAKNGKGEKEEEKGKKKPVISGASSGAGGGSQLKGRDAVAAMLRKANPGKF